NVTNDGTIQATTDTNGRGIDAGGNATIINHSTGSIAGLGLGITTSSSANVTNDGGTIQATGVAGAGIQATGNATVVNNFNVTDNKIGSITGVAFGIDAASANVTNNGGVIQATDASGTGIKVTDTATVTNNVNGTSIGQISGILFGIDATNATVTNNGKIESLGGTAIRATGTATVSNTGDGITTGVISGNLFGIDTGTVNVTANTGLIEATGANGTAISAVNDATVTGNAGTIRATGLNGIAINAGTDATVTNSGKILANGQGGSAITQFSGGAGTATVINSGNGTTTGIISADRFTIEAFNAKVSNTGGLI